MRNMRVAATMTIRPEIPTTIPAMAPPVILCGTRVMEIEIVSENSDAMSERQGGVKLCHAAM